MLVEEEACSLERRARGGKHHGAGQAFNGCMFAGGLWKQLCCLMLRDGEPGAIKDMLSARCLNGGGRYMLHDGVEVRDGSLKAIEQLIGYGLNAAFGNHHRAVGHCTPSEVGESKTLQKGRGRA